MIAAQSSRCPHLPPRSPLPPRRKRCRHSRSCGRLRPRRSRLDLPSPPPEARWSRDVAWWVLSPLNGLSSPRHTAPPTRASRRVGAAATSQADPARLAPLPSARSQMCTTPMSTLRALTATGAPAYRASALSSSFGPTSQQPQLSSRSIWAWQSRSEEAGRHLGHRLTHRRPPRRLSHHRPRSHQSHRSHRDRQPCLSPHPLLLTHASDARPGPAAPRWPSRNPRGREQRRRRWQIQTISQRERRAMRTLLSVALLFRLQTYVTYN